MNESIYPAVTAELAGKRRELAPETEAAFSALGRQVFAEGAVPPNSNPAVVPARRSSGSGLYVGH